MAQVELVAHLRSIERRVAAVNKKSVEFQSGPPVVHFTAEWVPLLVLSHRFLFLGAARGEIVDDWSSETEGNKEKCKCFVTSVRQ
jgi:hypothetical protein